MNKLRENHNQTKNPRETRLGERVVSLGKSFPLSKSDTADQKSLMKSEEQNYLERFEGARVTYWSFCYDPKVSFQFFPQVFELHANRFESLEKVSMN
jgi:hypothetical protein